MSGRLGVVVFESESFQVRGDFRTGLKNGDLDRALFAGEVDGLAEGVDQVVVAAVGEAGGFLDEVRDPAGRAMSARASSIES
jgi:hypothetical protein